MAGFLIKLRIMTQAAIFILVLLVGQFGQRPLDHSAVPIQSEKVNVAEVLPGKECACNGIPLQGKVQFVDAFPDIKIQYVDAFPDIRVEFVDAFPDQCGRWQEVDAFPDFKVQVVDAFPDVRVQKVTSFPGME